MARITLIRHGKAEMPRIGGNDFERGLIRRGIQNAETVGQFMQAHKLLPDLLLVSPARRTRQTYELMSASWPNPPRVVYEDKLYEEIWQAFAVLIPIKTVGVMGDKRTYENLLALRAVTSVDGMTADWFKIPDSTLAKASNKIVNNVKNVNRVVYDITSKPPGTIEWE